MLQINQKSNKWKNAKITIILYCIAIFLLFTTLFCVKVAYAAFWVDDPYDCPTSYQSITCSGSNVVCGYLPPTQCYNPASIIPPSSNESTWSNDANTSWNGGFLLDCYYAGSTPPYCSPTANDCDRNSTCYTTQHRNTTCLANTWANSVCGNCTSPYLDCDADLGICEIQVGTTNCAGGANNNYASCTSCQCDSGYSDCDGAGSNVTDGCETNTGATSCSGGTNNHYECVGGIGVCYCDTGYYDCDATGNSTGNGCEAYNGATCTVGSLIGSYTNASSCTCTVKKSYFQTGNQTNYSTSAAETLLWGFDWGSGMLMNLTNVAQGNSSLSINASGCIIFNDSTSQCSASNGTGSSNVSLIGYINTTQLDNTSIIRTLSGYVNTTQLDNATIARNISGTYNFSVWYYNVLNVPAFLTYTTTLSAGFLNYTSVLAAGFMNYTSISSVFMNRSQVDSATLNYTEASGIFYNMSESTANYVNSTKGNITTNLHVQGNISVGGIVVMNNGTGLTSDPGWSFISPASSIWYAGGYAMVLVNGTSRIVWLNSGSADVDFKISSDDQASILHVDADLNRIGFNTTTPTQFLDIMGNVNVSTGKVYLNITYYVINSTTNSCEYINGTGWRVYKSPCDL